MKQHAIYCIKSTALNILLSLPHLLGHNVDQRNSVFYLVYVRWLTLYAWYKYFKSLHSARRNDLCLQILRRQEEQTLGAR